MAVREILLLGNECLYEVAGALSESDKALAVRVATDLEDTLLDFRKTFGFGRAIAAPQIGESVRMIYMNLQGQVTVFINPVVSFLEEDVFEVWDDCMSFPGLEVLVDRYKSCQVSFLDMSFTPQIMTFEGDLAELFQHEYDHLNGTLAVQRAKSPKGFRMNRRKGGQMT